MRAPSRRSIDSGQRADSGVAFPRKTLGGIRAVVALLVVVALGAATAGFSRFASQPLGFAPTPMRFTIAPGTGLASISRELARQGVVAPAWAFCLLARLRGQGERLKAGTYEVGAGATPMTLLDRMVRGDVIQIELRLIEGWTFRDVRAALDAAADVRHDTTGRSERDILERLGAIETTAEGLFFPDTYRFAAGTSDFVVLRKASDRMRDRVRANWEGRAPGLPVTSPYQLLTLASIVEKETGQAADRSKISAVFLNRLREGMKLQSDPTVIYGLGTRFDGNLRRPDLLDPSPYNTYVHEGLPPSPIALPGEAALAAVSHPAPSKARYFVARGDGSSAFSETLADHNRAVNRFQRR